MMMPIVLTDALYPDWKKNNSFFYEGRFLEIREVVRELEKSKLARTPEMVQKFYDAHQNIPTILSLYNDLPTKRFPVTRLRHVTIMDCFEDILREEKINGFNRPFILDHEQRNLRVSCWGVHIPDKDITACRQKHLTEFLRLADERGCIRNRLSEEESLEVSGMLANSPAMKEDSRYGMYQNQHCGDAKPVLRVLGTEVLRPSNRRLCTGSLSTTPTARTLITLPLLRLLDHSPEMET